MSGTTPKSKTNAADKALFRAAGKGDIAGVTEALAKGADVNTRQNAQSVSGLTPLMNACDEGSVTVVRALLAAGADVHPRVSSPVNGASGQSALDYAIALIPAEYEERLEIVRMLLDAGADPNGVDANERTPLGTAAGYGFIEMAQVLIDAGAVPEFLPPNGQTALHRAANGGQLEMVRFLLDQGVPVDVHDYRHGTPLHYALFRGYEEMTDLFLARGADPGIVDDEGRNAFSFAAFFAMYAFTEDEHARAIRLLNRLLEMGVDTTLRDKEGKTPADRLAIAAKPDHSELLKAHLAKNP